MVLTFGPGVSTYRTGGFTPRRAGEDGPALPDYAPSASLRATRGAAAISIFGTPPRGSASGGIFAASNILLPEPSNGMAR